ncbi:MAG: universal stress protein [Flavobacteriales bacterium]|jgi:nucleotide-binding universal stress UspA family protein
MKILCPTDLTLAADIALTHAGHLAARTKAAITLFHVLTKEELAKGGQVQMNEHSANLAELAKKDVKVEKLQREGATLKQITAESANGYKLMVAGTHGVQGFRQSMFGSDMLKLVRDSAVPTLVMQSFTTREPFTGRIVMPVAPHDDITPLLDAVCIMAKAYGAEVDVYQILKEGENSSNTLLRNKQIMHQYLDKQGVKHREVNEPVPKFYEGYAERTIHHANTIGAGCIAIMAKASGEHKKIADDEKQEIIVNKHGIPVLCA